MAIGQGRWGVKAKAPVVVSGNDTDAQAFIAAAGITDTTQINAINTLVLNFKNYGIWSKMKAIYPFVGGTANTHKFNLKNPADSNAAFRLGFYGGMTHDSNGVSFGGTNGGAFTYFNAFTNQTKNNLHLSLYTRTRPTRGADVNDINMFSGYAASGWTTLRATSNSGNFEYFSTSYTAEGVAVLNSSTSVGFSLGSRTSSTAIKYYKNTISVSGTGAVHNDDFKNAELTLNGNALNAYSAGQYAFASLGDGLTDAEAANFYTAVQTFQTTLGRQVGVPIVADTDAQAFLNAAVITNTTQASAVNTLVLNLKTYGLWTKMKAIYPFVGGTANTHKFNLKNPADSNAAFRLGFYGGMTHDSNGVSFGGSNGGAYTYFNAFTNQAKNDLHLSAYARTRPTRLANANDISLNTTYAAAGWTTLRATSNSGGYDYFGTSDTAAGVASLTTTAVGFSLGSRTSATTIKCYKNSTSASGNGASHTADFVNGELTLNGNNAGGYYSAANYAFVSIGNGLTDAEAANFYIAVQAYQTTLGRQV